MRIRNPAAATDNLRMGCAGGPPPGHSSGGRRIIRAIYRSIDLRMKQPRRLRLDLIKYRLRIIAVFDIPETVIDQKAQGEDACFAFFIDKGNLNRLRYDVKNCQAELLADEEVLLKGTLPKDRMVTAEYVNPKKSHRRAIGLLQRVEAGVLIPEG